MTFRIIINILRRDGEVLNPIVIQFVVALTTTLMVIRFVLDALRHRSTGIAIRNTLIVMDAVTQAMILYSLGIMQRPSNKDYYYKVWAVLLVTLRYSVKIGRPAGIALKQTPLVDLMSSFWAANILRSKAPKILKVTGWLLWSVNSLRIIHGFVSSEFANDSHRDNLRLLTEYMRHEHKASPRGDGDTLDPSTMKGYRYLVLGEAKKRKVKKETSGQARDGDMVQESENIRSLLQVLGDKDKEVLTLEKIWEEPADILDKEVKDLCLSFALYKLLRRRFFNFRIHEAKLKKTRQLILEGILGDSPMSSSMTEAEAERAFRVSEAELSFLNDFFNSRHAIVFAKGFPFIRVLLSTILIWGIGGMAFAIYSFSKVGTRDELGNVHGGVTFTWFLLSFLFVKETWEITTYVFSDWTKIILLCQYVQKPWWLRSSVAKALVRKLCRLSVPWLPRWHGKVGQCNILGKVGQCNILFPIRFAFSIRFVFGARYSRYFVHLSPEVKRTVMNCLRDCLAKFPVQLDNYLERAFVDVKAVGFPASVRGVVNGVEDCAHILLVWHIATYYCGIHHAKRRKVKVISNLGESHCMVALTLSRYCAYVLTLVPPLVPGNSLMGSSVLKKMYEEKCSLLPRPYDSRTGCTLPTHILVMLDKYASGEIHLYDEEKDNTILKKGAALGKKLIEAIRCDDDTLEDHHIEDLWRFLSEFWAGFVIHLAASTRASQHKIFLSSGGELMTHLWALLTHAGILGKVQHGDQDFDTALTQGDIYDRYVQS